MRCSYPTLLVACATLLAACQKDIDTQRWVEVTAESYSGAKVVVDGVAATWADGDELRVNGATATVSRIDGHAYIEATAVNTTGVNRALYPASLNDATLGADAVSISLPAQYRYRADAGGHQLLEIPMAARSEGGKPLHFQHLTGAMVFTISNELGCPLTLDHLTVQSNRYSLSGSRNIDFRNIKATLPAEPIQDTDRTVMLIFDGQTLAAGDSLRVTIPIAPVDSNNRFTVTVSGHYQGTRYTFNRAQSGDGDGSLVRNQLGYATTLMNESSTSSGPLFNFTTPYNGSTATIYISNPQEFKLMTEVISQKWNFYTLPGILVNYNDCSYKITKNINMQGYSINPISGYSGLDFDGGDSIISNLTINGVNGKSGLFDTIAAKNIHNIKLKDVVLRATGTDYTYVAPLICIVAGAATISNCSVDGVSYYVSGQCSELTYGGLIALISNTCEINTCSTTLTDTINHSTGKIYFGGIAGDVRQTINLSSCTTTNNDLSITGKSILTYGGLLGRTTGTPSINNSSWTGDNIVLNSTSTVYAGGMVGRITGTGSSLTANSSHVDGTFLTDGSTTNYGYYVGKSTSTLSQSNFVNCTNNVTVNGNSINYIGG